MASKKPIRRKKTPTQLAHLFGTKIAETLNAHDHYDGLSHCLALLVCGHGKRSEYRLIIPGDWDEDEAIATMASFIGDTATWGKAENCPHSGNVHEAVAGFMKFAKLREAIWAGAESVALLIAHPEGAATFSYRGDHMRAQTIATVEFIAGPQ